jgi:hypothetical protein
MQGLGDRATLEQQWPKGQIVQVVPSLFAYCAPVAKEVLPEPGVAYWSPPRSVLEVSGVQDCALAVVEALQRAGAAAKYTGTKKQWRDCRRPDYAIHHDAGDVWLVDPSTKG